MCNIIQIFKNITQKNPNVKMKKKIIIMYFKITPNTVIRNIFFKNY